MPFVSVFVRFGPVDIHTPIGRRPWGGCCRRHTKCARPSGSPSARRAHSPEWHAASAKTTDDAAKLVLRIVMVFVHFIATPRFLDARAPICGIQRQRRKRH